MLKICAMQCNDVFFSLKGTFCTSKVIPLLSLKIFLDWTQTVLCSQNVLMKLKEKRLQLKSGEKREKRKFSTFEKSYILIHSKKSQS